MTGEAGHVRVKAGGNLACGRWGRGRLEPYVLAASVIRTAKERLRNAALSTAHEMTLFAWAGNKQARSIVDTAGQAMAIAITGFIGTLNLPLDPLGGGVCEARDLLSCQIFRKLECSSDVYQLKKPDELDPRASGRAKHT